MQLVEHHCPNCKFSEPAPVCKIYRGEAGIWHCGNCETAYVIRIDFEALPAEEISQRRDELLLQTPPEVADGEVEFTGDGDEGASQLRLQEIEAELHRLRKAIENLEFEAEQLRS